MRKKVVVLFLTALTTAAVFTGCGIKQTADTVTVEAGQELVLNATDFFNVKEEKADGITFDISKVDINKVGEYDVTAAYKKDTFTIKVTVEDTTAPMVEMKNRYVITNDIAAYDPMQLVEGIYDASEFTTEFIRFEKTENLDVMDDTAIKALTDTIPVPCAQEELKALGSEEVPTEEGIYRTVLAVTDAVGNTQLEEVYIILDTTGALIEEVEDKTIEVEAEDIDTEPEVNPEDYTITDNVDGSISVENITCELELRDEENHEYIVHVSYTDRAGNESTADFLIMVKEKQKVTASNDSGNSNSSNSSSDSNGSSENSGSGSESTDSGSTDSGSTDSGSIGEDGSTSGETSDSGSAENSLTPAQQAVINAGYGVVVDFSDGDYGVMVHDSERDGGQILYDYLATMGYYPTNVSGGWINAANDQYMYVASGLQTLLTEDDPEFWD